MRTLVVFCFNIHRIKNIVLCSHKESPEWQSKGMEKNRFNFESNELQHCTSAAASLKCYDSDNIVRELSLRRRVLLYEIKMKNMTIEESI